MSGEQWLMSPTDGAYFPRYAESKGFVRGDPYHPFVLQTRRKNILLTFRKQQVFVAKDLKYRSTPQLSDEFLGG